MNLKKIMIAFTIALTCICACKKEIVEPSQTTTTTTTTITTTTNSKKMKTDQEGSNNPNHLVRIVVTPNYGKFATIMQNSISYSAKAYNGYGNELITNFTWTTEHDSIGSIDSLGVVEGVGLGRTFVQASAEGIQSNLAEFFVVNDCPNPNGPPPVASPEILGFPLEITLNVGESYELNDYIEAKRTWVPMYAFKCSADPAIAYLPNPSAVNAMIIGLSPGKTIVTLSFNSIRKYILVEVNP